jgi:hypothetical protein
LGATAILIRLRRNIEAGGCATEEDEYSNATMRSVTGPPKIETMTHSHDSRADAVRYVVLRRLAAGMRHALMGELQGVQFAADLTGQMVKRGVSGSSLSDAVNQISEQARGATAVSRSIMEWLRPEPGASTEVEAALRECVKVAGEVWILRGIKSTIRCETGQVKVERAAALELVVVSLLALTDVCPGSLDIDLGADRIDGKVAVTIDARPADRRSAASPMFHRALDFDDVKILADADGIASVCEDSAIRLEFPALAG